MIFYATFNINDFQFTEVEYISFENFILTEVYFHLKKTYLVYYFFDEYDKQK
jgi:hypothetical protein